MKNNNKEQLILPKKDDKGYYISYSQYTKWKKSKREYIRSYFFKEGYETNEYAEFGTKVGEALENNDFSGFTKEEQEFLSTVPRLDEFEREVDLYFEEYNFRVMGYVDSSNITAIHVLDSNPPITTVQSNYILDYKTADIESKRAYYESDEYSQLDIYSMAIEQETGLLPDKVEVVMIGRSGNAFKGEKLKLTCEQETISRTISGERLEAVRKDLVKVAKEIADYYSIYLKMLE